MARVFVLENQEIRWKIFKRELIGYDVTIATHIDEALELWKPPYDFVFLDHDLGRTDHMGNQERNTGSTFVREKRDELLQHCVLIHSFNEGGANNMKSILLNKPWIQKYSLDWNWDVIRELINDSEKSTQ